jgi:probable phosphoglycerate mutase
MGFIGHFVETATGNTIKNRSSPYSKDQRFFQQVTCSTASHLKDKSPEQMVFEFSSWKADTQKGTLILIARHGQTISNVYGRIIGSEVPYEDLTDKGVDDAKALAASLVQLKIQGKIGITSVHCSPLVRAVHTGNVIADQLEMTIDIHEGLREINWGKGSGLTDTERQNISGEQEDLLMRQHSGLMQLWDHLPSLEAAEKYNDVLDRALLELQDISKRLPSNEREALLISHGRLINTLMRACLVSPEDANRSEASDRGKVPYPGNCDIAVFLYDNSESRPQLSFQGLIKYARPAQ